MARAAGVLADGESATVIRQYNNRLVETISNDVGNFAKKLEERKLIPSESSREISSMRGVRRKEKADIVMKKVLNSLDSAQCKEEWFREFTELFAAEDAYHEIAERMTEFYEALRMIDDTTTTISSGRFPSGCIIDVDDMNMLYSTLKITPQPSEKFLICHCSFQTDLTIRIYPLVSPGPGWFERFGRGYVFVWGAAFGAGIGGPIGAAIGGVVMDKLFGQHLGEGSYVDRSAMVTITARELSQAIPNKGIDDKKTKKVYTFVPNLQDRIDYPE